MARPPEVARDQAESAFTPILREVWQASDCVLAVAFVDQEGECIDYCSSLDPFDVKVCSAHMLVLMDCLEHGLDKLEGVRHVGLEILAARQELWVERLSDEYILVLMLDLAGQHDPLRAAMVHAAKRFRREVGIAPPDWDHGEAVLVTVRPAVGWDYAPSSYADDTGRVGIDEVMGRWTESRREVGGVDLVCFRVRTEAAQELTLVHDPEQDAWRIRA